MYCVKLTLDEAEGGNSCFKLLPWSVTDLDSRVEMEVIQCTCLSNGGCAMIKISDREGVLSEHIENFKSSTTDEGYYMIDRISSHQLMAIVINNSCRLSKILSESGCFMTSAVKEESGDICWTILGPNSEHLRKLVKRLNDEGFDVKRKSTYLADLSGFLSNRQEEALYAAVENGFYDIPRRITLSELSKTLGYSKSTLDVMLRSAEKKIMQQYVIQGRDHVVNKNK